MAYLDEETPEDLYAPQEIDMSCEYDEEMLKNLNYGWNSHKKEAEYTAHDLVSLMEVNVNMPSLLTEYHITGKRLINLYDFQCEGDPEKLNFIMQIIRRYDSFYKINQLEGAFDLQCYELVSNWPYYSKFLSKEYKLKGEEELSQDEAWEEAANEIMVMMEFIDSQNHSISQLLPNFNPDENED